MTTVLSTNRADQHDWCATGREISGLKEYVCNGCGNLAVGDGVTIYEPRPCTPFRALDNVTG